MQVLTALEHEVIPISADGAGFSVTVAESAMLARVGELRRGFCVLGHRHVKLAQYCGVVNLGDRVLEVLPKTSDREASADNCRGVLLRLLRLSDYSPYFSYLPVGQHLSLSPLLEAFIAAFYQAITTVIRGGLLRQYLEHDEDLPVVRGRIAASRQLGAHANRLDTVACVYDELTADNTWNRVLKKAVRVTRSWLRNGELGRRWVELMSVLDEVNDMRLSPEDVDRLVFDRRAERYRSAIDWARWILSLLSPSLRAGSHAAPALLFDMNRLFESAVAAKVSRSAANLGMSVTAQESSKALAMVRAGDTIEPAYVLRPDLVLRRMGEILVIADTKWKRIEFDRKGRPCPGEDDMYQMHAYASAYQCRDLAVIYPWTGASISGDNVQFYMAEGERTAKVHVLGLDVDDDALPLRMGTAPLELSRLLAR